MTATVSPTQRIERLNRASARVIEPDEAVPGTIGEGQLLPDELLSIHQLPEFQDLTPEQKARLSREEIASIVDAGIRFECVLMAGFSMELATSPDLSDPAVVYALHEMGEETRHSRLFSRLLAQIQAGVCPWPASAPVPSRATINRVLDRRGQLVKVPKRRPRAASRRSSRP